jgi:hypothetical protein
MELHSMSSIIKKQYDLQQWMILMVLRRKKSRLHLNMYLMLGLLFSSGCGIHSGVEITDSAITEL